MKGRIAMSKSKSNKALLLKRVEFELTQRMQMHFPWGRIPPDVLATWNGCPADVLTEKLFEMFSVSRLAKVENTDSILRRLYANKEITVAGRKVEVYELVKDADYATMYGSLGVPLENLWMTKLQREAFCKEHYYKLCKNGRTFFLHKKDEEKPATPENLVVAHVGVDSDGLGVNVYRFEGDDEWRAECQRRLVSPQL